MTDTFTFEIYVPSLDKHIRFKQFLNIHYKTILKYIQNNDNDGICDYFDWLINELSTEDIISALNRVDKFIIILNLYIICVESQLDITLNCESTGKDFKYTVDLVDILDKITNINISQRKTINIDKQFIVDLGFPIKLYYNSPEDLVFDCVHSIKSRTRTFSISKFNYSQRQQLINELPAVFLDKVYNYIIDKSNSFHNIPFLVINSPFDKEITAVNYTFNLVDDTFLEFIKNIFGESLISLYDLYYICSTKMNIDLQYLDTSMTPGETVILLKKYENDINKQAQAQNASSAPQAPNQSVNMPLNVPYTGMDF
jgi:hypothetical protein